MIVKSLIEYLNAVKDKVESLRKHDNYRIYYRGEAATFDVPMIPSVFRGDDPDKESKNYFRALRRFPDEFSNLKSLDILAKLQHYRYPTRMLDFTVNSLVALFFACAGDEKVNSTFKEHGNGHVFIYAADYKKDVLNFKSDRALLLSVLPRFTGSEQRELEELFEKAYQQSELVTNDWVDNDIGKDNYSHNIRKYVHELRMERAGYENHRIDPSDILKGYFVKPNFNNPRLKTQGGLFALFGLGNKDFKQAFDVKDSVNFFDIEIDKDYFDSILVELDYYCNINYSYIYDDLESTAKAYSKDLYKTLNNKI